MMKFSELLEEYLTERDHQNSDYYDNRYINDRTKGRWRMQDLADQMDVMVSNLDDEIKSMKWGE